MYMCTFHLRRSRPCRNCGCEGIRRRRKVTDEGDTEEGEITSIDSNFVMDDNHILYVHTHTSCECFMYIPHEELPGPVGLCFPLHVNAE